jgi:hypothetical protein
MTTTDSIGKDQRIASTILWGAIAGGMGMLIFGDADGNKGQETAIILGMATIGAVAGYVTGGRPAKD